VGRGSRGPIAPGTSGAAQQGDEGEADRWARVYFKEG
jgi:hypothetical protein